MRESWHTETIKAVPKEILQDVQVKKNKEFGSSACSICEGFLEGLQREETLYTNLCKLQQKVDL